MEKKIKPEELASTMWDFVHDINCGYYDGGNPLDKDLMAINEIIEAAEEIITNKEHIIKDIIK